MPSVYERERDRSHVISFWLGQLMTELAGYSFQLLHQLLGFTPRNLFKDVPGGRK